MKAIKVMNPDGIFLYVGQTVREASEMLIKGGVNAAPVLNQANECMGIVSKDLLLNALIAGISGDTEIERIMQIEYTELYYEEEILTETALKRMEFAVVKKMVLQLE